MRARHNIPENCNFNKGQTFGHNNIYIYLWSRVVIYMYTYIPSIGVKLKGVFLKYKNKCKSQKS